MSAEQFDGAFAGPLAQPAVDILPMATGRKGKQTEAEPEALAAPAQPGPVSEVPPAEAAAPVWAPQPTQPAAADHATAPVNPWTGAPAAPQAPPVRIGTIHYTRAPANAARTDSSCPAEPSNLFLCVMKPAYSAMKGLPAVRGSKSCGLSRNVSR